MKEAVDTQNEVSVLRKQLDTFYQVNRFISSIDRLDVLLDLIMQEAETAVEAEASCIALYNPSDDSLNVEFASGEKSKGVRYLTLGLREGILGHVAATRTPLVIDDVREEPRFDPSVDEKTGFKTRCILASPIIRHDELLGVLEVINKKGSRTFTEEDARVLEVVSNQAAVAIENARLVDRLVQSEQLSAIGHMAASIIHDIRNPLTVISGFGSLLESSTIPPEKRRTYSAKVKGASDRVLAMCQELLDYSKGGIHLELENVDLGCWLEQIADSLRGAFAERGIVMVTEFEYQGQIKIDCERMKRVLINLANNARDSMPDGGNLTISTMATCTSCELKISDTGHGIAPELRSKILEPFASFGKANGTGLGLAIARDIVVGHGGAIQFESTVSGENGSRSPGTTFTISLPFATSSIPGTSE